MCSTIDKRYRKTAVDRHHFPQAAGLHYSCQSLPYDHQCTLPDLETSTALHKAERTKTTSTDHRIAGILLHHFVAGRAFLSRFDLSEAAARRLPGNVCCS